MSNDDKKEQSGGQQLTRLATGPLLGSRSAMSISSFEFIVASVLLKPATSCDAIHVPGSCVHDSQMDLKPEASARRSVCYYNFYYEACGLGVEPNVKYGSIPSLSAIQSAFTINLIKQLWKRRGQSTTNYSIVRDLTIDVAHGLELSPRRGFNLPRHSVRATSCSA